ncbi:phage tail tape measure protein [Halonatronum saccharophilum]|uniref:phage tail tape measure protein n=1 Tax=Halonatronum saccharophilum TaxID=150060 RepID=UPI000484120C|nr:phage tail tape measure protein [Halonatronum saccharophilum]
MNRAAVLDMLIRAREDLKGFDATVRSVRGLDREMRGLARSVEAQSRKMMASIEKMRKSWMKVNNALKTVRNSALALFSIIVAKNSIPIKLYADLERELSNVNTLLNLSREELKQYEEGLMSLSNQTGKSAVELSQGLYDVVSAGVSAGNSLGVLEQATKAAQAGQTQVNTAVRAGISTINAYGMSITELNDVYDIQFNTVKNGIITYEQLASNMGKLIPSAARLDEELANVYGSLAFLTQQGQSADQASTSLARAFDELSSRASDISDELGINVFDEVGEFRGLPAVMEEMSEALRDYSTEEQQARLQAIGFGEQAARAITPAIQNYEQFEEIINDVADSTGSMDEAHQRAVDNIYHQANQLRQIVINNARAFGSAFEEEVLMIIDRLKEWANATGQLVQENQEAIKTVILFAARLAGTVAVIATVASAIMMLLTPLGLVGTGIAILYASWRLNLFGMREITQEVIDDIKAIWESFKESNIAQLVIEFVGETWEAIQEGDLTTILQQATKLAIGLKLTSGAIAGFKSALIGASALFGKAVSPYTLAAVSLAVHLREAQGEEDFRAFGANMAVALAAGLGIGMFTGSPHAGALAFTVVLNLRIGERIDDKINEIRDNMARNIETSGFRMEMQHYNNTMREVMPWRYREYEVGGYTGDDIPINEVAGVVHGGEWVAPAWMVQDSGYGSIIQELERKRQGFKDGGYVGSNLSTLQDSGLDNTALYGILENLAKIAHDTEEFAEIVNVIASVNDLKVGFEEQINKIQSEAKEIEEEHLNLLDEIKNGQDNQTQTLAQELSNLASNFSGFASQMQQATGNESWGLANNLLGSAQQGYQGFQAAKGASSALGMASGALGVAGAGVMAYNAISSWSDRRNQAERDKFDEANELAREQVEIMKRISQNTAQTANNIIKMTASHSTMSNIRTGEDFLEGHLKLVKENRPDFIDEISVYTNRSRDYWSSKSETGHYGIHDFLETAGYDMSRWSDVDSMSFDELKEFNKVVQDVTDEEIRKVAVDVAGTSSRLRDRHTDHNFDEFQEQLDEYVQMVKDLEEASQTFQQSVRYESFESVEWVEESAALEQYREQLEQLYVTAGRDPNDYAEDIESKIEQYAEDFEDGGKRIVVAMQDVRSSFVDSFADGSSLFESFAIGIGQSFTTLSRDISQIMYDNVIGEEDGLDDRFNVLFGEAADSLAKYGGDNPVTHIDDFFADSNEYDSLLKDMETLREETETMDILWDSIREDMEEIGYTSDEIDLVIPLTEAERQARELADTVSNSLSSAMRTGFESGSYYDFTRSMGQSIYDEITNSMFNAFADSQVYQEMFSDYFDFDSEEFQKEIEGMNDQEVFELMMERDKDLREQIKSWGYAIDQDRVPQGEESSNNGGSDYYSGASVSGEEATIINQKFIFAPNIDNLYGENQTELFDRFLEWKEEQEEKQA